MFDLRSRLTGQNFSVAIVLTSALSVVLFMTIAATVVYRNTRSLVSAQQRVTHTHEVLAALSEAQMLVDQFDSGSRLFVITGDPKDMYAARGGAFQFRNSASHVSELMADNPGQENNSQELASCAQRLVLALDKLTKGSDAPAMQVQRCQQTLSLMQDQERRLLLERDQSSQHSSFTSAATQAVYGGLALSTLLVLFGFLLRDAVLRQRYGRNVSLTNERLAQSVSTLEGRAEEASLLTACRDELQLCLEIEQVYESAAMSFSRLLEGTSGCLCMINSSRNHVEVVSRWGETTVEDFVPEACCSLRSGNPRWRAPKISEIHCTHFATGVKPERYLCLPIVAHGNALGVLFVQCVDDKMMEQVRERLDGVRQFVQLTGMTVAALNLRRKLEHQSIRDGLTGLFNRHSMQIALEREISRSARRGDTLAVMMLDVDHFKRFNDTHGHAAGDAALKAIAEVFRSQIRAEDVACRYGGEEFTIILPDVTPAMAYERADIIRQAVQELRVPLERGVFGEVTISIGVSLSPNDGRTTEELLRRADQALYRAKRQGRNQVSLSEVGAAV